MLEKLYRVIDDFRVPTQVWDTECGAFFYEARQHRLMVTVTDQWGRVSTGWVYRNSRGRTGIIEPGNTNSPMHEIYYFKIVSVELAGPVPDDHVDPLGSWSWYVDGNGKVVGVIG